MEYTEFLEKAVSMVGAIMGNEFTVSIRQIIKTNGMRKAAVVIREKDRDNQIVPVIYLKSYFEMYRQGENMEECVMKITEDYREGIKGKKEAEGMHETASDWGRAREQVYPILLSISDNREILKHLVYREFLDLAVCYMIRFDSHSSLKVSKNLCQLWGIREDELHYQAMENMKKDGYTVTGMEKMISELAPELAEPGFRKEPEDMYIVTNKEKWYGAAGILLDVHFLTYKFGVMNFYILPSSIHETILVPDKKKQSTEELNRMVQEVNREQVLPEERLADHAYYYDWDKGKIEIAS